MPLVSAQSGQVRLTETAGRLPGCTRLRDLIAVIPRRRALGDREVVASPRHSKHPQPCHLRLRSAPRGF
jgi:hypothetical protein